MAPGIAAPAASIETSTLFRASRTMPATGDSTI
jgi:hypothetical protein